MATQTTTTGGSYTPNVPSWAIDPLKQGIAGAVAATQQNPYAGLNRYDAGWSPGQWDQVSAMSGVAGYKPGQISPQQIGAITVLPGQVNQFAGGTGPGGLGIAGLDMSGYMNPYQQAVIDQTGQDIARQTAIQQQQNNGQAARAGAFGGDRAAIVNTETQRNANDTFARTVAALNAQNFGQAQTQANTDLTRQLQAGTTQVGADLTAQQSNQAAALRAAQGNQSAQLQADQGNQYAGLQAQNLRLNALGQTAGLLSQEQASRQRGLDYKYQDDSNRALWGVNGSNNLLNATSRLPWGQITPYETTGTTVAPGPSTTGQIIGGLTSGVGLLGALGGKDGVSGGLGTIGNGISSLYNGVKDLFSDGTNFASTLGSGFGGAVGSLYNDGLSGVSDSLAGAGDLLRLGLARGGLADFAHGGTVHDVDDLNDPTFAPLTAPRGMAAYAGGGQVQGYDGGGMVMPAYADPYGPTDAEREAEMLARYRAENEAWAQRQALTAAVADATRGEFAAYGEPRGPQPSGLAAAVDPMAPPLAVPDGPPEEPGLPVPPIPPDVVPAVPGTGIAAASAAAAPAGIAPAVAQPVSYAPPTASGQGIAGLQAAAQPARTAPASPAAAAEPANPLWNALIRAGGAMMASRSTTGLGAVGEGMIAGVDSVTRDKEKQLEYAANKAQLDALERHRLAMEGKTERDNALKNTITFPGATSGAGGSGGTGASGGGASFLQTDAGGPSREFGPKMVGVESNGRDDAKNPLSSATGAGQFIDGTWLSMVRKHAPDLAEGKSDAEVLALRKDGDLSRAMVTRYAQDNTPILQKAGVPANDTTLALAHRFGPGKAVDVLKAAPDTPITELISPQVMRQNPDLRGKTVGQVQQFYASRFGVGERAGTQVAQNGRTATDASGTDANGAAARPTYAEDGYGRYVTSPAAPGRVLALVNGQRQFVLPPGVTDTDIKTRVDAKGNMITFRESTGDVIRRTDAPGGSADPGFTGNNLDGQALNQLRRLSDGYAAGTLSVSERKLYEDAATHLQQPRTTYQDGQVVSITPQLPPYAPRVGAFGQPSGGQAGGAGTREVAPGVSVSGEKEQKPLTESQSKSNMFGLAMTEGQRIISEVPTPGNATIMAWRNAPESLVNMGLSEKDQQYFNGVRQFAAGVLRKETGASFGPGELADVHSRFFALPSDGPAVAAQKERARLQAISALRAEIPGGFRGALPPPDSQARGDGQATQATRAAPAPGTIQGGYRFKGGNPADQSSWEAVR